MDAAAGESAQRSWFSTTSKTLIHRVRHTVICLKTTQCTGRAAPSDVLCYGNTRRYGRQATMTLIHLSRKGL